MTSKRLPGKILKTVLGKTLLEYHIERLKLVPSVDEVIVATTTNEVDNPIAELCTRLKVLFYRGSEENVLDRYYETANYYGGDVIIRVTSDCPIIDPLVIEKMFNYFADNRDSFDYVSNIVERRYPRGMDAELFSFQTLKEAYVEAKTPWEREHVTPFIYNRPDRYRLGNVTCREDLSNHRWTVDTPEDFQLIKIIIENLYPEKPKFSIADVLRFFERNPDYALINRHVKHKTANDV